VFWLISALFAQEPAEDWGDEPTRVFVSEFQAVNSEAGSLAALLSGYLVNQLDSHEELDAISAYEAPEIQGYSASLYLLSCPGGEYVGCAYVIGDTVDAEYAVAGTVEALAEGTRVRLSIIDVRDSREALSFEVDLGLGDDERFAEGVSDILLAVIAGEQGAVVDIREGEEGDPEDFDAVNTQLEALASEMGGVDTLTTRSDQAINRPEYTLEDLSTDMETDAAKPWEVLGMSPGEYVEYKNSGLTVNSWRQLAMGRKGQFIVRAGPSVGWGPYDTQYRGWYSIDPDTFAVLEARAWQARQNAGQAGGVAWLGFGLTPVLELNLGAGVATGRYAMHIQKEQPDEVPAERPGEEFPASNLLVSARVLAVPWPTRTVRPIGGAGATFVLGEGNGQNLLPGAGTTLPDFDGSHFFLAQAYGGAEVSLNPRVDLYGLVPVSFLVGGWPVREHESGAPGTVQSYQAPPDTSPLAVGVELGISVRLGGTTDDSTRSDWEDEGYDL
jgi:hypothetical protein